MHSDWTDLLRAFKDAQVEYLLVGGHAVAVHGYNRVTEDLDLLVRPTAENSRRVFAALSRFGAITAGLTPDAFAAEQTVFRIGVKPLRIDVLAGIDGVTFDEATDQAVETVFADVPCRAIGVRALIANKLATGRGKDAVDAAWLSENHPDARTRQSKED